MSDTTITCPPHPEVLTPAEARELARTLLAQADAISPRAPSFTHQQVLLELDTLRARVAALATVMDKHLPAAARHRG